MADDALKERALAIFDRHTVTDWVWDREFGDERRVTRFDRDGAVEEVAGLLAEVDRLTEDRAALMELLVVPEHNSWRIRGDPMPRIFYWTREEAEDAVLDWAVGKLATARLLRLSREVGRVLGPGDGECG